MYDILTSIQMNLIDNLYIGFSMNWNIATGNIYGGDVGEDNDLDLGNEAPRWPQVYPTAVTTTV